MKATISVLVFAGLVLAAPGARADSVSINLGQSAQNFQLNGLGSSTQYGFYAIELGECTDGSCTLSGQYTSTSSFGDGSYSLVTSFPGASLPIGESAGPAGSGNENDFEYYSLAPGTTIYLDLTENGGSTVAIPIYVNGSWVAGAGFSIFYDSFSCSGLWGVPCNQINVGLTNGSSIQGPVSGTATFDYGNDAETPEPGTFGLLGTGLVGLAGMLKRRRAA